MSNSTMSSYKLPPIIQCISPEHCLSIGKKVHTPGKICDVCLKRYDLQQLREWAHEDPTALSILDEEFARRQEAKGNIEARGRYLCAFEDPDYTHCRWRQHDVNLRGTRTDCGVVRRKGSACVKCWRRHLQKIGIVQYFTPWGLCHEEADKASETMKGKEEGT
jgi:hypothetical protein